MCQSLEYLVKVFAVSIDISASYYNIDDVRVYERYDFIDAALEC